MQYNNVGISQLIKKVYFFKLQFLIRFRTSGFLPEFKGSVIRGGFGHIFRKLSCINKRADCKDCFLATSCAYANIFTTPSVIKEKTQYIAREHLPHPFAIRIPFDSNGRKKFYSEGSKFEFDLIIVGEAGKFIPYFVYTFVELGKRGLGKQKCTYELEEVIADNIAVFRSGDSKVYLDGIYRNNVESLFQKFWNSSSGVRSVTDETNPTCKLLVDFVTPTRIKFNGKYIDYIDFKIFITNILRRISLLAMLYCSLDLKANGLKNFNIKEFIEQSKNVSTSLRSINWYDWERYSTRQKTTMRLGGFVGRAEFYGRYKDFEKYIPLMLLGQELGVGKGTSFGLGRYKIASFEIL